jgi:hypothetical protein
MREIEPFVDGARAAEFLSFTRRRVLEMARSGEIPAHPIWHGRRKTWRFLLRLLLPNPAVPGNRFGGYK